MCNETNTEAELKQKRLRTTRMHFGYESQDEPVEDTLVRKSTRTIEDISMSSIVARFENLGEDKERLWSALQLP